MSTIPITKRGAELLKEELHRLKHVDRPAVINAISEARAQGDLSENAEYQEAREMQAAIDVNLLAVQTASGYYYSLEDGHYYGLSASTAANFEAARTAAQAVSVAGQTGCA